MSWFTQNAPSTRAFNSLNASHKAAPPLLPSAQTMTAPNPQGYSESTQTTGQGINERGPSGAQGGSQDYAAIIKKLQDETPFSQDGLKQLVQKLNAMGIPAAMGTHANGAAASGDALVLPYGTWFDVKSDQGWLAPGAPKHWDPSVNVVDASGNFVKYGDYLSAKGLPVPTFTPRPGDGLPMPGEGGQGGGAGLEGYGPLLQPYTKEFQAPTGTDDPGFKFALQNGIDALQHSAAAHGDLLTGGKTKDLIDYVTGASLQDYAGSFSRAKSVYDTNYQVSRNNKLDPFNMLTDLTSIGANAAGAANASNSSYGNTATDLTTGIGNANAAAKVGSANAWSGVPATLADLANDAIAKRSGRLPVTLTANNSLKGG